jgi:hypothetical protein
MNAKLVENETTIKNLREEIEKLTKIQEQQKPQVKLMNKNKSFLKIFIFQIIRNNRPLNLH